MLNSINQFIADNYMKEGSKFCAEHLSIKPINVTKRANRLGIYVSTERKHISYRNNALKLWKETPLPRNIDANKFMSSFTPESVYILGFLWADGYINNKSQYYRINMEIKEKDAIEIMSIFMTTGKWLLSRRINGGFKPGPKITFIAHNSILYKFLESMDYNIKSYASATKILRYIPENLRYLWWRGFFDGDGHAYVNKKRYLRQIGLAGSYVQDWSSLDFLRQLGINFRVSRIIRKSKKVKGKYSKYSIAIISNKASYIRFRNYIYPVVSPIGLKRKRDVLFNI